LSGPLLLQSSPQLGWSLALALLLLLLAGLRVLLLLAGLRVLLLLVRVLLLLAGLRVLLPTAPRQSSSLVLHQTTRSLVPSLSLPPVLLF
jgi:hypothetical protein